MKSSPGVRPVLPPSTNLCSGSRRPPFPDLVRRGSRVRLSPRSWPSRHPCAPPVPRSRRRRRFRCDAGGKEILAEYQDVRMANSTREDRLDILDGRHRKHGQRRETPVMSNANAICCAGGLHAFADPRREPVHALGARSELRLGGPSIVRVKLRWVQSAP